MRPLHPVLLALILAPLAACASVSEAVHGPTLAPMGLPPSPAPLGQEVMAVAPPRYSAQPASANSLWRAGARAFFIDQRANNIGDILTVHIDIDDKAQTQNSTSSSRNSTMSAAVPALWGLEASLGNIFPNSFDPDNALQTQTGTTNAGQGAVIRSEKISLTVAAVVTYVLPNGNMVIQGTQEVRTNHEVRQLTVAGIVRPEDISASNTIRHTQIAEARISYGGRGDISRVQKTPAAQSLLERFSPF